MTKLLERAVEAMSSLPVERQNEIARIMLLLAGEKLPLVSLTPEEESALDQSEAAAAHGDFAKEDQIEAIWAKHGL